MKHGSGSCCKLRRSGNVLGTCPVCRHSRLEINQGRLPVVDLHLRGKNAVILGGTRGIGRAIADTFADEGANIALCARNADQVQITVDALSSKGVNATGAAIDIGDGHALKHWIAKAGSELGGIDILVSNAGSMAHGINPEAWDANYRIDLMGAVNGFTAAFPFLRDAAAARGDAAFIIISSVSALQASAADSYGPIKAALIHFAKGLAREHAALGLRTNLVSPGMVFFEDGLWDQRRKADPEAFERANARNPTGRCATPQEIANAAVFLASPVSSYTTGANLLVDGAHSSLVNF